MRKTGLIILASVVLTLGIGSAIFFGATPLGRQIITGYQHDLTKAGENDYKNRREVEDTCRAYIASYKADKAAYEQYKNDTDEYYQRLAQSYKTRANQTATVYNEYYLKNSYVFKNNVPSDIYSELPLLD